MPELRKDPITGRTVIVAGNRWNRPQDLESFGNSALPDCPFCEGNESATPGEILAARDERSIADAPGWRVRVVPNKYPALTVDACAPTAGSAPGFGIHDVIIESPRHVVSTSELTLSELTEVLWIYRRRLLELQKDPRLKYAQIFKNVGLAAGASIAHTHSQLVATPFVPQAVADELSGAAAHYQVHAECIFCELIANEISAGVRIVARWPGFVAMCPYAGRFPMETWVLPTVHASHFERIEPAGAAQLAEAIQIIIAKIECVAPDVAYNYLFHTAPFDTSDLPHYHWHMEIIPRLTGVAGFEWGAGVHVNTLPPEEAAASLRLAIDARFRDFPLRDLGNMVGI